MSTPIRQADLRAGYLAHKEAIDAAVQRVLDSGWYILGREVEAFEQEFAAYIGAAHMISCGNGTDALHLALRAVGIGRGDVVVTATNTAVATVAAIELAGATPLLVDVDEQTLTISVNAVAEALRSRNDIRAIAPVHLYGHPADMHALLALARESGVKVIEDCAQSHGAEIAGWKTGTFSDAAAFSFYPTKNLGALGDGGAVVTNDASVAHRARELRMYGWKERYISETRGFNTRLDELQAAILRAKLPRLDAENARRREIAALYDSRLAGVAVALPQRGPGIEHVFHQYVIRTPARDALREHLLAQQIQTAVLYPQPIHQQPAYRDEIATSGEFSVAERTAGELLCLPIHPALADADVERVCDAIIDWHNDTSRDKGE